MNNFKVGGCLTLAALLSLGISGCSSTKEKSASEKTRLLGVPSATVETDPLILNLEAAVRKTPDDPEAWNGLTKAYFDNKQYDKAVQAGNVSLQLKPENPDIRNIVFVSGLRIASSSLDGIRKDQPLTGSNLNDAEKLVSNIRQSLGETSLTDSSVTPTAPVKPAAHKTVAPHKVKKKIHVIVAKTEPIEAVAPKSAPVVTNKPVVINKPAPTTGSNPFGAFQ